MFVDLCFPERCIRINSVLATFKLSLLAINHFLRFSKSEFTAVSTSFTHCPEAVSLVSSVNIRGFVLLRHRGKSFIYSRKSSGPKIEPCGTSHLIDFSDEMKFLTWHFWFRFVR